MANGTDDNTPSRKPGYRFVRNIIETGRIAQRLRDEMPDWLKDDNLWAQARWDVYAEEEARAKTSSKVEPPPPTEQPQLSPLAVTQAAHALLGDGSVLSGLGGDLVANEAADTAALAGQVSGITGTLVVGQAAQTAAASVTVRGISPSARWCRDRVRELKAANKISDDITITVLAKRLKDELTEASDTDETLKPLTWRYIRNELQNWSAWPLDRI